MDHRKNYLAMFPGQGSQALEMGRAFLEQTELGRLRFSEADEALGFSLSELCSNGPLDRLSQTEFSQPAILTVSTIAYELFVERTNRLPAAAAGHSLGEYSALVAAKCIPFAEAVALVRKRGLYMQEAVAPGRGSMVAILGKEEGELRAVFEQVEAGVVEIANINAPGQIVIAGEKLAVDEALRLLGKVKAVPLPVSVPSHTSLMREAAEKLAGDLEKVSFSNPTIPVYSNVSATPSSTVAEIRDRLLSQLTSPVQWVRCVTQAANDHGLSRLVEFGHGQVLCGLAKRILPDAEKSSVSSPETLSAVCG